MGFDEWSASRLGNMACHNLLKFSPMPPGTSKLLGLGLNYCIKAPTTRMTTEHTFSRMIDDVRRIYKLRGAPQEQGFIKELYIKSEYSFDPVSDEIEAACRNFQEAVQREQLQLSRRRQPRCNLTQRQWNLINFFKDNDKFIIVQGDKNLGPCILDRKYYIYRGIQEHLGNETNYRQVSKAWATA
jgi:hypothetical protein